MTYEPNAINNIKFWGSKPKIRLNKKKMMSDEKSSFALTITNRTNLMQNFSNRPGSMQRRRIIRPFSRISQKSENEGHLSNKYDYRPLTSSSLKQTINYYNEIDKFEYKVQKIIKPTNFIDNIV